MAEATGETQSSDGNEQLIALVLSFVIPGVGQLYQGRTKEGALFLGVSIVLGAVTVVTLGIAGIVTGPLGFVVWAVNLYDVYTEWLDL